MKSQLVLSMTGFGKDPREEEYKKYIEQLRFRFDSKLSEESTILIVNDVATEKYKIAKLYQPPKICVTVDWLLECHRLNKCVEKRHYEVNKLFYGVNTIVFDYSPQAAKKIEFLIKDNGGSVKIVNNTQEFQELTRASQPISVILTGKTQFTKLRPYLESIQWPIVDLDWLQDSLRVKRCKFPNDYAFNLINLNNIYGKSSSDHLKKMRMKLENFLKLQLRSGDTETMMLEGTILFIADNVNPELASVLKKIVMVCGGLYLQSLSPIVTHILTDSVTEKEYLDFKVYGSLTFIVRVEWLTDTIYLYKRMSEEDYFIRSFKPKIQSSMHFQQRTTNNFSNSLSYGSLQNLINRKSISMSASSNQAPKVIKVTRKYQSNTFKGQSFYIQSSQKKEIQLNDMAKKIESNGGEVYKSKIEVKKTFCFHVLKDAPENQKLIDAARSITRNEFMQPISYRWINECLAKNQIIPYSRESFIYKPFPFKTPIVGFHKIVLDVLGIDDIKKLRLKQLYNVMGSTRNTPNKVDLTHCLCGENYKNTPRYMQIKKQNPSVKFLDWKWLIECAKEGKLIETDKFTLQIEISSTMESEQESKVREISM